MTAQLGEHFGNAAHSNGVHGLRLYPVVTPYVVECDSSSGASPQYFYNFTSYRNGKHGIFGKRNGALRHINAKLAENRDDDYHQVMYIGNFPGFPSLYAENDPNIKNALLIGAPDASVMWNKHGIFAPQDEYFHVSGATFVNYGAFGAITACASCDSDQFYRQGTYTYRFNGLVFVDSLKRVTWSPPYKDILYDEDGSLTGGAAGSWVTEYFDFNNWPECPRDTLGVFDYGSVCDPSVTVRRLQLDGHNPYTLDFVNLNVSSSVGTDNVKFRIKESYGWTWPLVVNKNIASSGKDYSVAFISLTEWQTMNIRYSEPSYIVAAAGKTGASGEWTRLGFTWWNERYRNRVQYRQSASLEIPAVVGRMPLATDIFGTGTWFYDTNYTKNWTVGLSTGNLNGSLPLVGASTSLQIAVAGIQCPPNGCYIPPPPSYGAVRLWSDPTAWPLGRIPIAGDNVLVNSSMNILLDISPPPLFNLQVYGRLAFADSGPLTLTSNAIVVFGVLECGTVDEPHMNFAEIVLTGSITTTSVFVDNNIWASNKVLLVLGQLKLHGAPRDVTWTKLARTAAIGDLTLYLTQSVAGSWWPGDVLTLGATEWELPMQDEDVTVSSISLDGRTVTLTAPLVYRHYSGPAVSSPTTAAGLASTATISAPVGLLTRNVVIRGNVSLTPIMIQATNSGTPAALGEDTYGGHLLVSQISRSQDAPSQWRIGTADVRYVELRNMGKGGTQFAGASIQYGAFLLDSATTPQTTAPLLDRAYHPVNTFFGCAFRRSFGVGFQALGTRNVLFQSNVVHTPRLAGVNIDITSLNASLISNLIVDLTLPPDVNAAGTTQWNWPTAAIWVDAPYVNSVTGNVVSGSSDAGYALHPEATCGVTAASTAAAGFPALSGIPTWSNNEAIGVVVGVFALTTPTSTPPPGMGWCGLRLGSFRVAKASHVGVLAVDAIANIALVDSLIAESHIGVSFNYVSAPNIAQARSDIVNTLIVGFGPATAAPAGSVCASSTRCRAASRNDPNAVDATKCASTFGSAYSRVGITSPQYTNAAKTCFVDPDGVEVCRPPNRVTRLCSLPWEKRYGLPTAHSTQLFLTGVTFAGFSGVATSACGTATTGASATAYAQSPTQVDHAVPVTAVRVAWDGVPQAGRFSFFPSDASDEPYGGDAFMGVLLQDVDGSLTGTPDSSILGPNPAIGADAPECTFISAWNGQQCLGLKLRAGIVESMDRDRGFRRLGSLALARLPAAASQSTGSVNWTNRTAAFRGPVDDMCPIRLYFAQYPVIWRPSTVTWLAWPATEPGQTRFHFFSPDPEESVVLKFFVQRPNSMAAYVGTQLIAAGGSDKAAGPSIPADLPQLTSVHGANLFSTQARHATLVLRGASNWANVPVDLVRLPSVQVSIKLSVNIETFFAGDSMAVVNNLALLLNIDASRIKVVNVAAGSVSLTIEILPPANATVLSTSVPAPSNASDSSTTLDSTSTAVYSTADDMAALSDSLNSLSATGQITTLGGFQVESLTAQAPIIAAANSIVSPSPSPIPSPITLNELPASSKTLSQGAIAGIVIGVVFGIFGMAAVGLSINRLFNSTQRPNIKGLTVAPDLLAAQSVENSTLSPSGPSVVSLSETARQNVRGFFGGGQVMPRVDKSVVVFENARYAPKSALTSLGASAPNLPGTVPSPTSLNSSSRALFGLGVSGAQARAAWKK